VVAGGLAVALLSGYSAAAQSVDDVVVSPQASGRWLRAESQHVVVYSDESPEILRRTVADLETLDQLLRGLYGRQDGPPPRRFPIYLVRSPEIGASLNVQYRRFMPGAAVTALSLDAAEVEDIFAVVVRDNFAFFGVVDHTAGDDVVLGAYALHFFSENFPFRQPRWLTKGAAIYYSSIDIRPGAVAIGRTPALFDDALAMRGLERIPDIITESGDDWSLPERQRFDAQSALLVRYLWADPDRKARLAIYLDRIAAGEGDPRAIWAQVFGQPLEALPDALRAFVRKEAVVTTLPRASGPTPPMRIQRMPAGADNLILELQQMKTGVIADRPDLLSKIRKAASRRPDERYSRQALARAEITLGDRDKGERLLEQLLAEDGDNLEALRLMGTSKLYRAAADKAHRPALLAASQVYLRRADAAEPNDYQTLFLLAQTMTEGDTPSPERLALLRRAVALAPEVTKIRLVAAVAFLRADDAAAAYQLLKPISADPNGGLAASQAKRVLEAMARVGEKP
jgi:tetratricopeptide (TPR) repeat protein